MLDQLDIHSEFLSYYLNFFLCNYYIFYAGFYYLYAEEKMASKKNYKRTIS